MKLQSIVCKTVAIDCRIFIIQSCKYGVNINILDEERQQLSY